MSLKGTKIFSGVHLALLPGHKTVHIVKIIKFNIILYIIKIIQLF